MDTRHRVYYLVNLNQNHGKGWWNTGYDNCGITYTKNLYCLQKSIDSLKIMNSNCDWRSEDYYQLKMSCKKEEHFKLVKLLDKLSLVSYTRLA